MALLRIQLDYVVVFGQFLLLSMWSPCYTPSRVENRKKIKIHGGFGSTLGDNFFMGTQNGSKLEI